MYLIQVHNECKSIKSDIIFNKKQKRGNIMTDKNKHIGLRCSDELLKKLKYLSAYEGRSINGEILYLINHAIREFESKNGPIITDDIK